MAAARPVRSAGKARSRRIAARPPFAAVLTAARPVFAAVLIAAAVASGGCAEYRPLSTVPPTAPAPAPANAPANAPATSPATAPTAAPTPPATPAAATLPRAEPVRIDIAAIGVHAPVGRVGLTAAGTVEVPRLDRPGETAWYIYGPTPGELGPAVIVGHVDSTRGPAVFFRLHELRPGDLIGVVRADGTTATFRTTSVEQVPKTGFPTERVYGNLDYAGLRLVTCGGTFVRPRGSYVDNVIAFAELVASSGSARTPSGG